MPTYTVTHTTKQWGRTESFSLVKNLGVACMYEKLGIKSVMHSEDIEKIQVTQKIW